VIPKHHTTLLLTAAIIGGCVSNPGSPAEEELHSGGIAYPFVDETKAIGRDTAEERFVIKSATADREYAIEIPGAARDYDVEVPLAEVGEKDPDVLRGVKPKSLGNPVTTDQEVVNSFPRLEKDQASETSFLDSAFGTGSADGPSQAPSYTLGLAKVNEMYRKKQFEYALIELNNLIAFYPNSPQLHKMKGTLLVKMRHLDLAERAWIRALELNPDDHATRSALARLQKKRQSAGAPTKLGPPESVPKVSP
jgi:tetratricopeptide (TPR) repeat protein